MTDRKAKRVKFAKAIVSSVVWLFLSFAMYLNATENGDIQDVAKSFVRQVVEKDTDAILQSYSMTAEFRAGMPNAATVAGWAADIDRLFGSLGDVVNSETVEHPEQGLRSIYLYFQGSKRPLKIWVTFRGTVIAGIHYDVWAEGYDACESTLQKKWSGAFLVLVIVLILGCFLFIFLCFFFGESLRRKYVKRLRDVYLYQNEHLQKCYTESQNPIWMQISGRGLTLCLLVIAVFMIWTSGNVGETLVVSVFAVVPLAVVALLCEYFCLLYFGFFVEVNEQYLVVRIGFFRRPVLQIELKNITNIEIIKFNPIVDFSGYGIRIAPRGIACFMSGNEGVQVTISTGEQHVIGSDIPDRLAQVIQKKVNAINFYD